MALIIGALDTETKYHPATCKIMSFNLKDCLMCIRGCGTDATQKFIIFFLRVEKWRFNDRENTWNSTSAKKYYYLSFQPFFYGSLITLNSLKGYLKQNLFVVVVVVVVF